MRHTTDSDGNRWYEHGKMSLCDDRGNRLIVEGVPVPGRYRCGAGESIGLMSE